MKRETMAGILAGEGVKNGPRGYLLEGERAAACLVRGSADVMTVGRVARIELRDDCVMLETDKNSRYFFAYEDVLGLRLDPARKEGAAGFGR